MTRVQALKEGFFPLFIIITIILGCVITGALIYSNRGVVDLTTGEIVDYAVLVLVGSAVISFVTLLRMDTSVKGYMVN